MTQNSMNTPYAKRVAELFREAQNYLKLMVLVDQLNIYWKILKILLKNNANSPSLTTITIWLR